MESLGIIISPQHPKNMLQMCDTGPKRVRGSPPKNTAHSMQAYWFFYYYFCKVQAKS